MNNTSQHILIVAPNWVGDAVMSLGLVQALINQGQSQAQGHTEFKPGNDAIATGHSGDSGQSPSLRITVLASPVTAAVYRAMPEASQPGVLHILEAPWRHGRLQWRLRWQMLQSLRLQHQQHPFTKVYVLPNSLKSALLPWLARLPNRIGYDREARAWMLTQALSPPMATSGARPAMLAWYGHLAGFTEDQIQPPRLMVSEDRRRALLAALIERLRYESDWAQITQAQWQRCFHGALVVVPGAEYGPAKCWPPAYFAASIAKLREVGLHCPVLILGVPNDQQVADSVIAYLRQQGHETDIVSLVGKTTLDQAIALISAARAVLCNDSGLMHIAAGLNVPVHAIFGSTDPHHTPPLSPRAQVHTIGLACSPCFQRTCPLGNMACLRELTPDLVAPALLQSCQSP